MVFDTRDGDAFDWIDLYDIDALRGRYRNPKNLEDLTGVTPDDVPLAVKSPTSGGNHTVVLQLGDDNASAGEPGYAATVQYVTEGAERLATVSADAVHNHWGVYTKADAIGSGDTQPNKRLSVGGGSEVVNVDWLNVEQLKVKGAGNAGAEARLILEPETGETCYVKWKDGSSDTYAAISDGADLYFYNYLDGSISFELKDDGRINLNSSPLYGLRSESSAIAAGDLDDGEVALDEANGRLCWKDGSGSAYFAAGTSL